MIVRSLLVSVLVALSGFVHSQTAYRFRNFSITDGLSQSSVTCIVQDDVGTLWIGTQDGLNRFDGRQFEVFTSDDTDGLESEYIHCSLKDHHDMLWFGTSNGLTGYDQINERFKTYDLNASDPLSIESMDEASSGDLWLGTSTGGLVKWERTTRKLRVVNSGLPTKRISYVKFLNEYILLVSTADKGTFAYDIRTKKSRKLNPEKIGDINWSVKDAENFFGSVYVLSSTKGLWLYDYKTNVVSPFLTQIQRDFGINEISDVYMRSTSELYIATQNKGLITARKKNGVYSLYQNKQDIFQKNALLFNEINQLYSDKNGAIWIGTLRGLSCFDPANQGFLGIGPTGNLKQGLPSASVWAFAEDPNQQYLFVGTDFAVSVLNRAKGTFEQYYLARGTENDESNIMSLRYVSDGMMLVGCTDGLYELRYSGAAYAYKKIEYKKLENPTSFDKVYRILHYKDQQYFLATSGGVLLYDHAKKTTRAFVHNPKKPKSTIGPGICRLAFKGTDGTVYFGTSTGGLYVLKELRNGDPVIVPFRFNDALLQLTRDYISSLYQETENDLWIGTTGSGLLHLNLRNGKLESFTKKDGIPNNFVYAVLPDDAGNLWISTNKGLGRFNPSTKRCTNFSEVHGLMSNEFNTGAYLASASGELYFGGIAGYNFFHPSTLNSSEKPLEIRFTKFKLDDDWLHPGDKDAPFKTTISDIRLIELPYHQRSFTLHFVASDLMNPQLLEFKYRLRGSDEETIFLGSTNEIRFNSLSPGTYTLELYVRRTDGEWSSPTILDIEIASPFWWKWWFWVIVVLFTALLTYVVIRRRIEQARREQVRLEMKIVERTKEIRAQNAKIEMQKQIIEQEKNKVEEQKRLLQIEKDKTEKLLRNIIPESTAEELKSKGTASARAYKTVSVLFTDFVGFTKVAERMKPTELVNKLDVYFRKFDEIIVRNNLEKIKTIGDAYMCAGGVPVRNNTNPIDAVLAALQIQDYMIRLRNDAIANGTEYWELRLGINTGEVTAGVIGSERLAYDIWGATVNQAQRMEMMGEPGRVTISGATFKLIEPYFECTFRGKVQSKSKGMIDMFTVERIKPELSVNGEGLYPNERFQQIVNLHLYSSINYYKAERHIMKVLERGLSPKLHYHSIAHTKDVVRAVERYALLEGVTDEGLFLLKSAATYHDAGFVESYEKNEPIGARMAEEILPKYGYSQQHIDVIKELIFVTQIPHKPKNHLEEIICDADLDYLGRDDFHEIADKLRRELREHGKIDSDRQWDELQVSFLRMHRYFTPTAIASRQEKKDKNLQEVLDRLERNEYKD